MNRLHKHWLILVGLVLLILSLAACGGKDEPARVTEKFLRAAAENDLAALQETVDPDLAEDVMMMMFFQIGLQALVGGGSSEYTELDVETIYNDGQRATVRAAGKVRTQVLGTQMVTPFDAEVPLVNKGGQWYVTSQ
jgi:hypothetical protein